MPGSLLASQLATLEVPGDDEDAIVVTKDGPLSATIVSPWLGYALTRGKCA